MREHDYVIIMFSPEHFVFDNNNKKAVTPGSKFNNYILLLIFFRSLSHLFCLLFFSNSLKLSVLIAGE